MDGLPSTIQVLDGVATKPINSSNRQLPSSAGGELRARNELFGHSISRLEKEVV